MSKNMLIALALLWASCAAPAAGLSERDLAGYRSHFLERVIADNPEQESSIRKHLNGFILEGNMGIRLLDKFGIFQSNMARKDVGIERIRYYDDDGRFWMFIVMKDRRDGQLYTLFLEYEFGPRARCVLRDIYFSIVFEERMKEVKSFFEAR